jgi:low affinity Fe/Cu permease
MKFMIVLLLVIGTVPVYAQLETTSVPEIENPQECMQSEIRGGKGWVPFSIKMFYDTTKDHIMSVEHQGDTNPVIQQNDNVMIFQSDGEDTYKLSTQLNYDNSEKRAIYFEYWSEGNAMHTEIINYNGNSFCRTFLVTTTEPPIIPTAEELLGQSAYRALTEMPLIKDAINQNTNALNGALVFLTLAVIMTLLVGFTQAIVYVLRKKTQKKQIKLFDEAIRNSNKASSNSMMIVEKVEKKGDELLDNLNKIMGSRIDEMTNSTNTVMLDLRKVVETLKDENPELKIKVPKIKIVKPVEDEIKEIEQLNDDDKKKLARSLRGMKDSVSIKKLKAISEMFKKSVSDNDEEIKINEEIQKMDLKELTDLYNNIIQKESRDKNEEALMMDAYKELVKRSKR